MESLPYKLLLHMNDNILILIHNYINNHININLWSCIRLYCHFNASHAPCFSSHLVFKFLWICLRWWWCVLTWPWIWNIRLGKSWIKRLHPAASGCCMLQIGFQSQLHKMYTPIKHKSLGMRFPKCNYSTWL